MDAPAAWTAHNPGNTDVVLTPGGDAVASLFRGASDTAAVGALLRTSPGDVVGVYVYETNVQFSQVSWQAAQSDVRNQLQLPFSFDRGWQRASVGGLPATRIAGVLSTSDGSSVRFAMDVVQRPDAVAYDHRRLLRGAARFRPQQQLFEQVRRSIAFP